MIIFQITLSGAMLRALVAIKEGDFFKSRAYEDPHWMSTTRALQKERLITHEGPCSCENVTKWRPADDGRTGRVGSGGYAVHFHTANRKHYYEITRKGEIALELAATDLRDFLDEVQAEVAITSRKPAKALAKARR